MHVAIYNAPELSIITSNVKIKNVKLNMSSYDRKKIPKDKLRHLLAKNIHQGFYNMQTKPTN